VRGLQSALLLAGDRDLHGRLHLFKSPHLDLADALARHAELGSEVFQRHRLLSEAARVAAAPFTRVELAACTPGRGAAMIEAKNGARALVINVMGRVFMEPLNDPFSAIGRELEACPLGEAADAIVIDFHGEASSEKQGMAFFCDGRASMVIGTHTHVPTADHQILSGGTAYMTDAGMTGDYDSVIGMQKDEPLRRFTTGIPSGRFEPANGAATLSGVAVETDPSSGLATRIAPVRIGGRLQPALPEFWLS